MDELEKYIAELVAKIPKLEAAGKLDTAIALMDVVSRLKLIIANQGPKTLLNLHAMHPNED